MRPTQLLLSTIFLMFATQSFADYGIDFKTEEKCYFPTNRFPADVLRNPDGSVNTCFEPNPADTAEFNCNTNASSKPVNYVSGCKVVPNCGFVKVGTCVSKENGSLTPLKKK